MWKYLKAAFWHTEKLPILGSLPVNFLALLAFAALGFGHPAFWWVGAALELGFLFMLATNPRYQRLTDALGKQTQLGGVEQHLVQLMEKLSMEGRTRHSALRGRIDRVSEVYGDAGTDYELAPENDHSLQHLAWLHLKLLLAREHLLRGEAETSQDHLERQTATLRTEAEAAPSRTARESKEATLRILEDRLTTARQRSVRLEEINADLDRIEHQVELVLEKATLHANPTEVSFTIDLASQSLDPDFLGSAAAEDIQKVDSFFLQRA
jgi:hypothetical protein